MNEQQRAVMRQGLEALETLCSEMSEQQRVLINQDAINHGLAAHAALCQVLDAPDGALIDEGGKAGQEPVMIYHGRCTIDCGDHGHQDVELLKMIPVGSKLYTAPRALPIPESAQGWISVAERLPKKYEEVMVWPCPTDYCMTGEFEGTHWTYPEYSSWGHEDVKMRDPSHWMPLPKPPADKGATQ